MKRRLLIAVIGGKREARAVLKEAEEAGRLIAEGGATLVCGGLSVWAGLSVVFLCFRRVSRSFL